MNTQTSLILKKPERNYLVKQPTPPTSRYKHGRPALSLMTDFHDRPAVTVDAHTHIDSALEQMIENNVRLLFVITADGNLLGAITSYDIQGEKPMLYMQSQDCRIGICSRAEIEVQDIMTPASRWKTVDYASLSDALVNDIARTFQSLGQHHLIVTEAMANGPMASVRGIFSFSDLERSYGVLLHHERAESFFEIEQALNS